jgi:pilus assembly protein Flp/PilA
VSASVRRALIEFEKFVKARRTNSHYRSLTRTPFLNPIRPEEKTMKKFLLDETGLELSEYAVAAALVAIAVVGAFTALGTAISGKITALGTEISK